MARRKKHGIAESELTKGQLRKLNALRKSLGPEIADKAFLEWLANASANRAGKLDRTAQLIAEAVEGLIRQKKLKIPRGGYLVKRGRGRVIITRTNEA